jgi:hypothetical protein
MAAISSCSYTSNLALSPHYDALWVRAVLTEDITLTALGRLTFQHVNGLSYNVLAAFRLPVDVMLLPLSMVLCMSLVGVQLAKPLWVIWLPFNCRVSGLAC